MHCCSFAYFKSYINYAGGQSEMVPFLNASVVCAPKYSLAFFTMTLYVNENVYIA